MVLPQYKLARELEEHLGDPFDARNAVSFESAVKLDELEVYPEEACAALNEWGLSRFYVPVELGGEPASCEEVLHLLRVVARRDLTTAIAHAGTYLGALPVWMEGGPAQQERLAGLVLGGGQVALGLSERAHGSDLLASDVSLRRAVTGDRLSGKKWLIGNATRSRAITVFARTEDGGGPKGFSLLLHDKDGCRGGTCRPLPRVKTHGLRGADISGFEFEDCAVGADDFVGEAGRGLEILLNALQVTRTVCAAFSLGAADTALRVTLDFASHRRLYNSTVVEIPYPRALLLECFLDLLVCECAAVCGARALHAAPEQMSVWSAVVKTFVPLTAEQLIQRLSVVLGARFYLREGHCHGVFQKLLRDNAIVGLFDGSTAVNFESIALQLPHRLREGRPGAAENSARQSMRAIFDLAAPLPACRFDAFDMMCRGADPVLASLVELADEMPAVCADCPEPTREALRQLLRALREQVARLRSATAASKSQARPGGRPSAEQFRLAQAYGTVHTAACCLQLWMHSRRHLEPFFREGVWLVLCLRRLLGEDALRIDDATLLGWENSAAEEMVRLHRENRLFSLAPFELARRRTASPPSTAVSSKSVGGG